VCGQLAGGEDVLGKSDRGLQPHDIDAFWLQRKLSRHYDDPMLAQTRAGEVLAILKVCYVACVSTLPVFSIFCYIFFVRVSYSIADVERYNRGHFVCVQNFTPRSSESIRFECLR